MKKITSVLTGVFLILIFFTTPVSAKVLSNEEGSVTVAKSEVINDDLFIGAKTATINGTINGDVFIGAETVNFDGIVNGNLHIGASTVNLSGQVKGNVYVGAGTLNVTMVQTGGSLIVGAGTANLDKDSVIGGSLIAGAGNILINSKVNRNLILGAGEAEIGPETKVAKDFYYAVGNEEGELNVPESVIVGGTVYKPDRSFEIQKKAVEQKRVESVVSAAKITGIVLSFLGALLVGYLYLTFFRSHFTQTAEVLTLDFWKSLGVGFLVLILAAPALILTAITVIGIPLAGIAFMLLLLFWYLSKIIAGMSLGKWLSVKFGWNKISVYAAFAFGLSIIYLLKLIPYVNTFAGFIILLSGVGVLSIKLISGKNKNG